MKCHVLNFESSVLLSKCLRAKICSNVNVYFDPQGCQTLQLKESEAPLFSLGSWTIKDVQSNLSLCRVHIGNVMHGLNFFNNRKQEFINILIKQANKQTLFSK